MSLFRSSEPKLPAVLGGRWEIVRPLAEGGMGALYIARHRHTGRSAAVKLMNREDPQALTRFKLEATVAAQVDHPGIVEVFDADFESDSSLCFIAMELLQGRTLRAVMEDPETSPPQLIELLTQALSPLSAAHAKGFIHRDLKPENIFVLEPRREGTAIKLLDFGIAAQEGVDRMTRTGIAMGTPHYMSPEQAVNARSAGPASDVWSMGVMIYEAIRGQVPFVGESVHAVIVQACTREHEPLDAVVPDLDPGLARLVDRCLAKEPGRRPENAAALLAELRTLRRPTSLPATRPRRPSSHLSLEATSGMRRRMPLSTMTPARMQSRPRRALLWAGLLLPAVMGILALSSGGALASHPVLTMSLLAVTCTLIGALAVRPLRARASIHASRLPSVHAPSPATDTGADDMTAELPALVPPALGPDGAAVVIDLFADLTDHVSRRVAQRLMHLRNEHPDQIQLVFRPLPQPGKEQSWGALEAMLAVYERGGPGPFWAVFDALIVLERKVTPRLVEELAISVGLEAHDLRRALRARTYQRTAIACRQQAVARGIAQSPTVFVNGKQISGELGEEPLRWMFLDAIGARQKAEQPPADPGLMPTAPPQPVTPMEVTLRGVLIRYQGARNAPAALRRTRAQARLRAEKLTARALMPGADFADLGLRFGDQLLEPETTQPRPEDALSMAVAQLAVNEVCNPVEGDEGFYVAQRIS